MNGFVPELLELYKSFVYHRQQTLIQKFNDSDYVSPLLGNNKFTNVQRIFDRVSQYEVRNVLYGEGLSKDPFEVLKRVFLFNQFKTEFFWEILTQNNFEYDFYNDLDVEDFLWTSTHVPAAATCKLFTTAYVVPGKKGESKVETIHNRCKLLLGKQFKFEMFFRDKSTYYIFQELKTIPGIGDFLASQVCFDLLWHESFKDFKELYVLGPGAVRGLTKMSYQPVNKDDYPQIAEKLDFLLSYLRGSDDFPYIYSNGKKIVPNIADVQNTLCEFDKYLRIVRPDISLGNSSPKSIKNKYKPRPAISYVFPGWWVGSSNQLEKVWEGY